MGRSKKKDIRFDKESLSESMQEAYETARQLENLAMENYEKLKEVSEDKADMQSFTPIMNETLKVAEKALSRKVQVIKVQADTYSKTAKASEEENEIGMSLKDADAIHNEINGQNNDFYE
jgi:predicted CoA-binding protein